jgi:hypothetical protein
MWLMYPFLNLYTTGYVHHMSVLAAWTKEQIQEQNKKYTKIIFPFNGEEGKKQIHVIVWKQSDMYMLPDLETERLYNTQVAAVR